MRYKINTKIKRMTAVQRAYLAGIIDGEGSIAIVKARNKKCGRLGYAYRPVVHVANTHNGVLQSLNRMTGLGRVGKFDDERPNRKARYQWMIWSQQGAQLVRSVMPFLIIKRRQAALFLKFVKFTKTCRSPSRRGLSDYQWQKQDKFQEQMKELNK